MRIAIPTIWFHRGQTVVSQTLARALSELGHEVYIHARMGAVYGKNKQEMYRWGWDSQRVTYWSDYDLKVDLHHTFLNTFKAQRIDLVLFNEEYDWELVRMVKEAGFKVTTYMDYLHKSWGSNLLLLYHMILCSTKRTYDLMPTSNRCYIGWGIPEDTIISLPASQRPYLFFENAGWLGINDRKGLGTLLECYQKLLERCPELYGSLLVHAQIGLDDERNAKALRGVDLMTGSMNQPGLYHMAQVYCYPAILDGLGLSLMEAIASDCAVICPDAPPWNEFVEHERNGLLVPIVEARDRFDGIVFPEVFVDKNAWVDAMARMAMDMDLRFRLFDGAYCVREERLAWASFRERIAAALGGLA